MNKYFLNVNYYDYRGFLKGGGYQIGGYKTLKEALNEFAFYTSITDFETADQDEYVVLSIDSEKDLNHIKSKKFEWEE